MLISAPCILLHSFSVISVLQTLQSGHHNFKTYLTICRFLFFKQKKKYICYNFFVSQDVNMAPPPSTTPSSRCSSVHLENNTDSVGNKTPNNYSNTGNATAQPVTVSDNNSGNAMPGYLPQQPPQLQQSSHNSSG